MTDTTANDEFVGGKDRGYSGFLYFDDNGIPLVACIGYIVSTTWCIDTMKSTECRSQTSLRMGIIRGVIKMEKKTDLKLYLKMEANCQKTVFVRFL